VSLLDPGHAAEFLEDTLQRARDVEAAACMDGADPSTITARVAAVLVSAGVRASLLAQRHDVSPSEINRATLSWYEVSHLRRRELLEAARPSAGARLFA
jgi:hypothetical protein